jgi:hypothetical protein
MQELNSSTLFYLHSFVSQMITMNVVAFSVRVCQSVPSHSRHQGVASARLCSPVFHTWSDERNAPINQVQLFYFCSVFSHVLEFVSCISSDLSSFPRNSGTFRYRCISLQRRLALPQWFFTCKTGIKPIVLGLDADQSIWQQSGLACLLPSVLIIYLRMERLKQSVWNVTCDIIHYLMDLDFLIRKKINPFEQSRLFALFWW